MKSHRSTILPAFTAPPLPLPLGVTCERVASQAAGIAENVVSNSPGYANLKHITDWFMRPDGSVGAIFTPVTEVNGGAGRAAGGGGDFPAPVRRSARPGVWIASETCMI